jgi:Zn ribbon nucleic-acid-binding protein
MKKCPKCRSSNIKTVDYRGVKCTVCNDCGFDERNIYEQEVSEKKSQKAKGQFSPYKTGGKDRTRG